MKKYTVIAATEFNPETIFLENEDGSLSSIPMDESNSDYQAYLKRDEPQVEHLTEIVPVSEAAAK